LPLFERFETKIIEGKDLLNYSQLATVIWAYSTLKIELESEAQVSFWNKVVD